MWLRSALMPMRSLRPSSCRTTFAASLRPRNPTATRILTPLAPSIARIARNISDQTRASIEAAVRSAPVVLFMKGTPEMPQCGFSRASVQILGMQGLDPNKFAAYNVLEDPELRAGIKEYSEWPTIPQLYVENEFIGGCDILLQMHQDGQLSKLLEEKKLLAPANEDGRNA